jgi:hypothetical protein
VSSINRWISTFSVAVLAVVVLAFANGTQSVSADSGPGGFMDSATGGGLRSKLSAGEMKTFLPDRGRFTFPSPYNTQGARITNGSDCGGQDCVHAVGYSYWSNMNNHVGSNTILMFVGLERRQGGAGPTLFSYDKNSGQVKNEGPLFSADSNFSMASGEGWYFSGTQPTKIYMNDGPRMLRYDVRAHTFETVADVSAKFGSDKYIWQMHSSNDDRVHSFTLRQNSNYAMLGCVAAFDTGELRFFPEKGDFDECQVDKSGRWLVIKENVDAKNGEDNRIIDLQSGSERVLLDQDGAAGHSDTGYGYMVAEDNFNPQPGAVRVWDFAKDVHGGEPVASVAGQGTLVYQLSSWDSGLGHLAHGNSKPGAAISQQIACSSNASRKNLPRVNEIVCYRLDGSMNALIVAPNLTDLDAAGGNGNGTDEYWKLPKGNLDVTGEYFIWTGNAGTNRMDVYLVHIPLDKLGGSSSPAPTPTPTPSPTPTPTPTPSPTPTPTPTPTPAPTPSPSPSPGPTTTQGQAVIWTNLKNVTANANSLTKSGGCGGCADAGASSQQTIANGSGYLEFAVSETDTLRFIGFSTGSTGTAAESIAAALRLQAGRAEVREKGAYKSEIAVTTGDVLRITVGGGSVKYSKNGAVFYTSNTQPAYPLVINTSLFDLGATIKSVTIGSSVSTVSSTSGSSTPATTTAAKTRRTHLGLRKR